jgi:hypothetical protein
MAVKWLELNKFGCQLFLLKDRYNENKGIALKIVDKDLFESSIVLSGINTFFYYFLEDKKMYLSHSSKFNLKELKTFIPRVSINEVIDIQDIPCLSYEENQPPYAKFEPDSFAFAFAKAKKTSNQENLNDIEKLTESFDLIKQEEFKEDIFLNSQDEINNEISPKEEIKEKLLITNIDDLESFEPSLSSINSKKDGVIFEIMYQEYLKRQENLTESKINNLKKFEQPTVLKKEEVKLNIFQEQKIQENKQKQRDSVRFNVFSFDNNSIENYKKEGLDPFVILFCKTVLKLIESHKLVMMNQAYAKLDIIEKVSIDNTTRNDVINKMKVFMGENLHCEVGLFIENWNAFIKKGEKISIKKIMKEDFSLANLYFILHQISLSNNQYKQLMEKYKKYKNGLYDLNLNLWVEFGLVK